MAKRKIKNSNKKKGPEKINSHHIIKRISHFFKSEHLHFIFGIFLVFAGIYALLAIISYFFTGASDSTIVNNSTFREYITQKSSNTPKQHIDNWTGAAGAYISEALVSKGFGLFSSLIPVFVIITGLKIIRVSNIKTLNVFLITAFGLIAGSITEAFILGRIFPKSHINWGGSHGSQTEIILQTSIGMPGMILLIVLFVIISFVILKNGSMQKIQDTMINNAPSFTKTDSDNESSNKDRTLTSKKNLFSVIYSKLSSLIKKKDKHDEENTYINTDIAHDNAVNYDNVSSHTEKVREKEDINNDKVTTDDFFEILVPKDEVQATETTPSDNDSTSILTQSETINNTENIEGIEGIEELEEYDPKKDLSSFVFPTMDLLKVYNTGNRAIDMEEQNENKNKIINTLRNYGIEITSIKATVGPTITLYEIVPQAGVRISKIRNLEDDIALSLSALGIRIIAPMPGKGTVGIEVPNKDPQIVSMQSVIASKRFQECTYDLPVALGKTITNEVFIFDLAKMPHLLVAGATGQGKSVGLNAIITSLLYKRHPSELKMVLIDPKMVEFNIYSTIERHYLAKLPDLDKAIITDVSNVTQTLNSLTKEMDDRYELLMRAKVRTIKEYNEKFKKRRLNPNNGHRFLPYIVVVIDEFGDLIMTAGKEIEMPIARIAQKARAVGMHMVIATQRPTTNIITGTIKANFPARMAFRVTSQIDSRTILDTSGANQLIGRGDMLFSQGNNLIRIQCAFVDTPEVEDITQYIGNQRGYESAFALPEVATNDGEDIRGTADMSEKDVLFEEAARLIVIHQQGSTSLIQRKFSIGYNRAGRLMDQLEATGIVGPVQGSKPRDVYIPDEYTLEKMLDSMR